MTLTSPYPLSKGSGVCAATGAAIAPGSHYIAALAEAPVMSEDGSRIAGAELARMDYSIEAWNGGARPASPARLFGFWKTQYQPALKKKQILDDATLLEVFESLGSEAGVGSGGGGGDEKQVKFRYLLSLLLIRRRLLRVVGTRKMAGGKGDVMQVLRRGEPQAVPMEVVDPGLDDLSVADAMESLAQLVDVDEAAGSGAAEVSAQTEVKSEA